MFYKVIKDNKVIDVLQGLTYLKYQPKNKIWVLSGESEAQAILSSDGNTIWHEQSLYEIPVDGYENVEAIEISEWEYKQLKVLNMKTPEAIVDEMILFMVDNGII